MWGRVPGMGKRVVRASALVAWLLAAFGAPGRYPDLSVRPGSRSRMHACGHRPNNKRETAPHTASGECMMISSWWTYISAAISVRSWVYCVASPSPWSGRRPPAPACPSSAEDIITTLGPTAGGLSVVLWASCGSVAG